MGNDSPKAKPKPLPNPLPNPVDKDEKVPVDPVKNYLFRCAVLGFQNVGKSSLINRYVNGSYSENAHPVTTSV